MSYRRKVIGVGRYLELAKQAWAEAAKAGPFAGSTRGDAEPDGNAVRHAPMPTRAPGASTAYVYDLNDKNDKTPASAPEPTTAGEARPLDPMPSPRGTPEAIGRRVR